MKLFRRVRKDSKEAKLWGYKLIGNTIYLSQKGFPLKPVDITEEDIDLLIYGLFENSPLTYALNEETFKKYYGDKLKKEFINLLKGK